MLVKLATEEQALAFVKRMVFLAYNAVGRPSGMGFLQAVKDADEERVWTQAYGELDYITVRRQSDKEVYCDYVCGRMMKWGCTWEGDTVTIPDREFRWDYQGFSGVYKDNKALVDAAILSLGYTDVEIS